MPITMGAFFLGSLGVIGLPPTLGLISKFHLVVGAADAGEIALLCVFLISTLLNAAYFLPLVWIAFFPKKGSIPAELDRPFSWAGVREAPWACVVPLAITALLSTGLFFCSGFLQELTGQFIKGIGL
jgi:multicomponent Na+:H+ antiporter subunit D